MNHDVYVQNCNHFRPVAIVEIAFRKKINSRLEVNLKESTPSVVMLRIVRQAWLVCIQKEDEKKKGRR